MQQPGGMYDERGLVVVAQRGELNACAQLTARHQQDLLRLAFLWTNDQARAVALAQQALARALLELPRFDPEQSFRPWLLQRLALEATQHPPDGSTAGAPALFGSPGRFQVDDERSRLRIALQRLDAPDRIALLLHDVGNLDEALLASTLGKRPEALRATLAPARRRLLTSVDLPDERALRAALNDAAVDAPRVDLWPELEPEITMRLAQERNRRRLVTAGVGGGVLLLLVALGVFIFGGALRGGGGPGNTGAAATPALSETPSPPPASPTPIILPPPADVPERLLLAVPSGLTDWNAWDYALLDPAGGPPAPLLDQARYLTISPDGQQLFFVRRSGLQEYEAVATDPLGLVLWRVPLNNLALDDTGQVEPRALFVNNLVIVAVSWPGGAEVVALDARTGQPTRIWRYLLPDGSAVGMPEVTLAPGQPDSTLVVTTATSRREAVWVEIELSTFEVLHEQIVSVDSPSSTPPWAELIAANFGLSAGPVAAVQTPNGEQRYAVAPYLRAVAIVDSVRNVLAAQYTLDISVVAPPGQLPAELRGSAPDWPAGQLTTDGETLYIAGPLRALPAGLVPTIWEIDVAGWAVRRELPLAEPGRINALALGNAGATLYIGFQPVGSDSSRLLSLHTDAAAQTPEELDAEYTITGSIAGLYQAQYGRAPSVAGVVPGQPLDFEALPRAVLAIEPISAWPEDEVTVRLTFLAPNGEPLTPEQAGVRFDPTTSVTVLLASGAVQQLVVLGQAAHGLYSADVQLTEPGIWDAVATINAADVAHWTVEQPGALVVRSGLRGSDGMIYWPIVTTQPDPLQAGSTAMITLRFMDLINGELLPTGVTFAQGVPTIIRLSFIDDASAVVYESVLLRAGPGLYNSLISTPPEGRYRLRVELRFPAGQPETLDHGFITVTPAR